MVIHIPYVPVGEIRYPYLTVQFCLLLVQNFLKGKVSNEASSKSLKRE